MRLRSILVGLPLLMLYQFGSAQQTPSPQSPPPRGTASFEPPPALADAPLTAQTFVIRATIVNMAQTELADLALSRSHDAGLQAYARKMRDEHWRAQEKLRAVAGDAKIAMPAMADKKHQDLKDALKRAPPESFQRYASEMLPIIRSHRDAAYALHSHRGA